MPRKRNNFSMSAKANNAAYSYYYRRLMELSMSMFAWKNLPETIDERFLELALFEHGSAVFFKDEIIGYLCLNASANGNFGIYGEPIKRRAYSAYNSYSRFLNNGNSVIIYNNYLRDATAPDIEMFAARLYDLDRTIDVNARAQKTPILLQGTQAQKLSLVNVYKEYDGNSPVIFGYKNLDLDAIKVLKTDAPYVGDKLYQLKTAIWNEALTYLGISNISINKKERLVTDEVQRNLGGTIASRHSRLEMRRKACERINDMFGLDIWVEYRENDSDQSVKGSEEVE